MKVSIITLHTIKNYGSVLQTYATQRKFEQMGVEASNFLCQSYGKNSKNIISYLQRARNKYLLDFRRISRYFSLKDRIRVWGTGLLAPVFCRAWNIMKSVRSFILRILQSRSVR